MFSYGSLAPVRTQAWGSLKMFEPNVPPFVSSQTATMVRALSNMD